MYQFGLNSILTTTAIASLLFAWAGRGHVGDAFMLAIMPLWAWMLCRIAATLALVISSTIDKNEGEL